MYIKFKYWSEFYNTQSCQIWLSVSRCYGSPCLDHEILALRWCMVKPSGPTVRELPLLRIAREIISGEKGTPNYRANISWWGSALWIRVDGSLMWVPCLGYDLGGCGVLLRFFIFFFETMTHPCCRRKVNLEATDSFALWMNESQSAFLRLVKVDGEVLGS